LEIERLEGLGFDRRNMKVLPDGSIVLVEHNETQGAEDTITKTIANDRLAQMMARKQEIDYTATASAVASLEIDPDLEKEYLQLCHDIDEALKLLD